MARPRLTQAKLEKVVRAVAAACGAAQVIIDPDGTVRVLPVDATQPRRFDKRTPVDL